MELDWNKGYSATYYATKVDVDTWRDGEKFSITGGKTNLVDENLRNAATIDCENYDEITEKYIRVWMNAVQEASASLVPLFTGIVPPPVRDIDGRRESHSLEGYSVLSAAEDVKLPRGWYAVKNLSGGEQIKALLQSAIPAPIDLEPNSPLLSDYIIAEDGEDHLSMTLKILTAIGWRMYVDGYGRVHVCSMLTEPVMKFDSMNNCCLQPKIQTADDWYKKPNVFRAVIDDMYAIARDDDPNNVLSITQRGREVWAEESDCALNQDETLAEYAYRMLKQEQRHAKVLKYNRKFYPDIFPSCVIGLHFPEQKIEGNFYVTNQSFNFGGDPTLSEEVIQL